MGKAGLLYPFSPPIVQFILFFISICLCQSYYLFIYFKWTMKVVCIYGIQSDV
jgi:hypothetical protein